jgi:hypothetical protein
MLRYFATTSMTPWVAIGTFVVCLTWLIGVEANDEFDRWCVVSAVAPRWDWTLTCDDQPGNYNTGFDTCQADSGNPMGVYPQPGGGSSTFFQGQRKLERGCFGSAWTDTLLPCIAVTPPAQAAPASSSCSSASAPGVYVSIPCSLDSAEKD